MAVTLLHSSALPSASARIRGSTQVLSPFRRCPIAHGSFRSPLYGSEPAPRSRAQPQRIARRLVERTAVVSIVDVPAKHVPKLRFEVGDILLAVPEVSRREKDAAVVERHGIEWDGHLEA